MTRKSQPQPDAMIELWSVLTRYRSRFIFPAFVVMTAVLLASLLLPRKYKATATFERRTDMVMHEIMTQGAPRSFQDPRNSLRAEILGQPAVAQVVEDVKSDPAAMAALERSGMDLQKLHSELSFRVNLGHDVSTQELDRTWISFTTSDPKLAQFCVNRFIENHIARTRQSMDARLRSSIAFFDSEAAQARSHIEALEDEKLAFQMKHAALLPDQPGGLQALIQARQLELDQARQEAETARLRVESLQEQLADIPKTIPTVITEPNPELRKLQQLLSDAQQQLVRMTEQDMMTERHPDVVAQKTQIARLREQIAGTQAEVVSQTRVDVNPQHKQVELTVAEAASTLKARQAHIATLTRQIDQLNEQAASLYPVRGEYERIERELAEGQRQVSFWEDQKRRVELALTAETGERGIQLNFMAPAGLNRRPVSPDLTQVILVAIALGGIAGGLSVFMAYRTDETFAAGSDLAEALDLPLMGSVSEIISRQQRRMRRLRQIVMVPVNTAVMATVLFVCTGIVHLSLNEPERFDQLRADPSLLLRSVLSPQPPAPDAMPMPQQQRDTNVATDDLRTQLSSTEH